jgi:Mitochondrial carrier protein
MDSSNSSGKGTSHVKDFLVNFVMGGVSGGISKTITAPLERIKIVL